MVHMANNELQKYIVGNIDLIECTSHRVSCCENKSLGPMASSYDRSMNGCGEDMPIGHWTLIIYEENVKVIGIDSYEERDYGRDHWENLRVRGPQVMS